MTPDEQRRLALVEVGLAGNQADVRNLAAQLSDANRKLDQLVAAANMGRGAWWLTLRLGGLLLGLAALAAALAEIFGAFRR